MSVYGRTTRAWSIAAIAVVCFCVLSGHAYASVAPHVPEETDTDACAMCHRAHTAGSDTQFRSFWDPETFGSALILGTGADAGDTLMCFTCHGVDSLGSVYEVQSALEATSAHLMAPFDSVFGPSPKDCSDCHDSHGVQRRLDGSTFPGLLRAYDESDDQIHSGDEYCAACHAESEPGDWDGLTVWASTAHSIEMTGTASGTLIVCLNCHDAHGSGSAPMITDAVYPPAAPATATVTANDRLLCMSCHVLASATWSGATTYTASSHAVSDETVPILGSWASVDASRTVGECQVCHAPMGRSNEDSSAALPKMLEVEGRALCDSCHDADGPASTDVSSTIWPQRPDADLELVAAYRPSAETSTSGEVHLYTRDTTGTAPLALIGPRGYTPAVRSGAIAAGDIDGDGVANLVLADAAGPRLDVFSADPLRGISLVEGPGTLGIAVSADFVAVADFILDGSGLPEIAVVETSTASLYLYRYNGTGLTSVAGPLGVGSDVSGIASGDVTGTAGSDLVVTARGDDQFRVFTENAGSLAASGPFASRVGPTGPSVGDAWKGGTKAEIVILNTGETTGTVSVFGGDGIALGHVDDGAPAGAILTDSVVANVLPSVSPLGTSGAEIGVVYANGATAGGVDVFAQNAAGGLLAPLSYATGSGYNPGVVEAGDVDDDGVDELLVGNAGLWSRTVTRQLPSVQVMNANAGGTALDVAGTVTLWGGGVELAGAAPSLVLTDLGAVGPSRHPVGTVADTHVSTETVTVALHVECTDCHNTHEATSTVAAAPDVNGRSRGTWGVSVDNVSVATVDYTEKRGVDYEYELCFKCHSGWAAQSGGDENLAFSFNSQNPSVHAVEEATTTLGITAGSFVGSWTGSSVLYCIDCHADSRTLRVDGPHVSDESPILVSPYRGVMPSDPSVLCYDCHDRAVYYLGTSDGVAASTSLFYDSGLTEPKLHKLHVNDGGFSCSACHVAHGSRTERHLLDAGLGYTHGASGGSCGTSCHTAAASHVYSRP